MGGSFTRIQKNREGGFSVAPLPVRLYPEIYARRVFHTQDTRKCTVTEGGYQFRSRVAIVRWIGEHQVPRPRCDASGSRNKGQGISPGHLGAGRHTERLDIAPQYRKDCIARLDEVDVRRAPGQGLESQGSRAGEKVENTGTDDSIAQYVEPGLPDFRACRAGRAPRGSLDTAPPEFSRDNPKAHVSVGRKSRTRACTSRRPFQLFSAISSATSALSEDRASASLRPMPNAIAGIRCRSATS